MRVIGQGVSCGMVGWLPLPSGLNGAPPWAGSADEGAGNWF